MNSNTIQTMYGCALSPPGSSSSKPVASSKPEAEYNVPNLGGARGQVWQPYDRHRATTSYQADSNIQDNSQQEGLSMPSLSERGRASNRRSQESSQFTQKTRASSPRKVIGKRSASIAEMGEGLTSSKRIRQEVLENAHSIPVVSPVPAPSSSEANGAAVTGDVADAVQLPSDAGVCTGTCCLFDRSRVEWVFWLTEDPDAPATSNSDGRCTGVRESNCSVDDIDTFLDTWWKGIQKAKESPNTSGDKKSTSKGDPLKKEDREHAVPAATWYPWSALYGEAPRHSQGLKDRRDKGHEGPISPCAVEVGEVPYGGGVIARGEEDTGIEFPARDLATPGVANNSAMASQSLSISPFTLQLDPLEVRQNTSQLLPPSSIGPFTSGKAHTTPVGPSLTESDVSSPRTTGEPSTAGATPNGAFRYSAATEAKIWGWALQDKYPAAYRLFDPSECAVVIEGTDLTRFVRENRNKITKAARDKAKLWVCQATAKWSKDGRVSYMAEPCRVANTSHCILLKHISTVHLGKVLPKYETKKRSDDKGPGM